MEPRRRRGAHHPSMAVRGDVAIKKKSVAGAKTLGQSVGVGRYRDSFVLRGAGEPAIAFPSGLVSHRRRRRAGPRESHHRFDFLGSPGIRACSRGNALSGDGGREVVGDHRSGGLAQVGFVTESDHRDASEFKLADVAAGIYRVEEPIHRWGRCPSPWYWRHKAKSRRERRPPPSDTSPRACGPGCGASRCR